MIDFDKGRWEKIKADYNAWWQGDIKQPLLQIGIHDLPPNWAKPADNV